jgi:hypothetical protein
VALRGIIGSTLYVRIRKDEFQVRHVESGREVRRRGDAPFSTSRLLIGDFVAAADSLERAFRDVRYGPRYFSAPVVVMHPLELNEGGFSPVERRVLHELAAHAGGKRTVIWEGRELADAEIKDVVSAA